MNRISPLSLSLSLSIYLSVCVFVCLLLKCWYNFLKMPLYLDDERTEEE